jgi:hypothetical protein
VARGVRRRKTFGYRTACSGRRWPNRYSHPMARMLVGYARCSADAQDHRRAHARTHLQMAALYLQKMTALGQ